MLSAKLSRAFAIMAFIFCSNIHALPVSEDSEFEIRIVHTNDMHARFEETSKVSSACSPKEKAAGECYGGFARLATLIRQFRNSGTKTIFLNAGDTYQGSIWFNVFKWEIVSKFLNILAPDAISLGNHEFDDGVAGLLPFIEKAEFPIVTANLDLSEEADLKSSKLKNSTIIEVNGRKIGVIGYLTPDTKDLATTGKVIFLDEVEVIREEVKKLKDQGVKIFIALGHSGFVTDKKIAMEVEEIDLVIGGHSNTFLFNGKEPSLEIPEGFYPTEVVQKSGRKTYVVQAYAYTKYLGNLDIKFDEKGEITHIEGNPILVDGKIKQAKDVLDELDKWRAAIDKLKKEAVGSTKVFLNGDSKSCRREECNLGNLITDAMIKYNVKNYNSTKNSWTDAAIAVFNGGSIRSSITRENNDTITRSDVQEVLPFGNVLVKTNMTGEKMIELLEWSVRNLIANDTSNLDGGFLQLSGIQVLYDLSKEFNSRIISVKVRCASCKTPTYSDLEKEATYTVLLTDFLINGGDKYGLLKGLNFTNTGVKIDEILIDYLKGESPVYPGVEWRITYAPYKESNPSSAQIFRPSFLLILIPLISLISA